MKKRWIVFMVGLILALVAMFFCAVAFFNNCIHKFTADGDGINGKNIGESIIQSLNDKDSESLKALFSDYVKKHHDLDEEIDTAFSVINEEIVSHGVVSVGSTDSTRNGKVVYDEFRGTVPVTTSDENKYIITFDYIETSPNENTVGLKRVSIFRDPPEDNDDIRDYLICLIGHEEIIYWEDTE